MFKIRIVKNEIKFMCITVALMLMFVVLWFVLGIMRSMDLGIAICVFSFVITISLFGFGMMYLYREFPYRLKRR